MIFSRKVCVTSPYNIGSCWYNIVGLGQANQRSIISATNVLLVDSPLQAHQNNWPFLDRERRSRYHTEQSRRAEEKKQWFAQAFHLGRLLRDSPDDADLKRRRDEALKLHAEVKPPMPSAATLLGYLLRLWYNKTIWPRDE